MSNPSNDALNEEIAAGGSAPAAAPVTSNVTAGVKNPEKPMGRIARRKKKGEEYEHACDIDKAIKSAATRKLNEVSRWNAQSRSWLGGGWDERHPDGDPHNSASAATQAKRYADATKPWSKPVDWKPMMQHRNYFDVPYEIKDYAKSRGLRWDPTLKKWYKDAKQSGGTQYDIMGLQLIDEKGQVLGTPKRKVYVQVDKGEEARAKLQGFRKDSKGWWTLMRSIWNDETLSGYKVLR